MSSAAAAVTSPSQIAEPLRKLQAALAATVLLGAFLLFQVQPLITKALLPWYGGTPAVWTTALVFFQTALVVGYAYAFVTTRFLPPASRSYLHTALAVAALTALPILPAAHWKPAPDVELTGHVLLLLLASVGAPFCLLAATGPLVQDWFHRATAGRSPYRLYALSNLGSLLGLLTYPFVIEPNFTLPTQATIWSALFCVFVALVAYCAWAVRNAAPVMEAAVAGPAKHKTAKPQGVEVPFNWRSSMVWITLAACGTFLLMIVTNHLSQDLPSGPLLWIAPLVSYLGTFIICFDRPAWYRPAWVAPVAMLSATLACRPLQIDKPMLSVGADLALLFTGCFLCHGELARRRPAAQHASAYYLFLAVGGALGGALVSIVAPRVFDRYWEWIFGTAAAFLGASVLAVVVWTPRIPMSRRVTWFAFTGVACAGLSLIGYEHVVQFDDNEITSARNEFGVVQMYAGDDGAGGYSWLIMKSGTTRHGMQAMDPVARNKPTTYYTVVSGVGSALSRMRDDPQPRRVGVVGLGAGTLAVYGRKQDVYRFYEINPNVVRYANDYFTYLRDSAAVNEVLLGDARLALEREEPQNYDLLALDAFTSDSIPAHLLTVEAFQTYLRHVNETGIIAVHISNKFLTLDPVISAVAQQLQLTGLRIRAPDNPETFQLASRWILLTRRPDTAWWRSIRGLEVTNLADTPSTRLWSDSYSNILPLLK